MAEVSGRRHCLATSQAAPAAASKPMASAAMAAAWLILIITGSGWISG